jgi:asparagine synthase (glutamine-hydrolysing)
MRVTREDAFDAQPLRNAAGDLTFVCDARLDNREEIAAALGLAAETLAGLADSALLFEAFQAWGDRCAERLVGDFTFAAWDGASRILTLARDHMGQRHVFFHAGDGFFAFATDRKGLWALPDVPRRLPIEMVKTVLVKGMALNYDQAIDVDPPDGLGAVPGGAVLTVSAEGAISARRYWTPHAAPEHVGRDEDYYVDMYRRLPVRSLRLAAANLSRPHVFPPSIQAGRGTRDTGSRSAPGTCRTLMCGL